MLARLRSWWASPCRWSCDERIVESGRVKGWGWKFYEIKRCVRCGKQRRVEWWNG